MKDLREQVDQFIEGFFDGSIITVIQRDPKANSLSMSMLKGDASKWLGELVNELITNYIHPALRDEVTKLDFAFQIYQRVLQFRATAIIQNNPESLKELGFFKSRATNAEEQAKDLQDKLKNAYEMIQNLELRLVDKEKGQKSPGTA